MRRTRKEFNDHWSRTLILRKPVPANDIERAPDRRGFHRLGFENIDPIDACLIVGDKHALRMDMQNLSSSGLCCRISEYATGLENQSLAAVFVLPLEGATILRVPCRLVARETGPARESIRLRLQFNSENSRIQDLIHRFIITKQFQRIKERGL